MPQSTKLGRDGNIGSWAGLNWLRATTATSSPYCHDHWLWLGALSDTVHVTARIILTVIIWGRDCYHQLKDEGTELGQTVWSAQAPMKCGTLPLAPFQALLFLPWISICFPTGSMTADPWGPLLLLFCVYNHLPQFRTESSLFSSMLTNPALLTHAHSRHSLSKIFHFFLLCWCTLSEQWPGPFLRCLCLFHVIEDKTGTFISGISEVGNSDQSSH